LTDNFHLIELDTVESTMTEAATLAAGGQFDDWTTVIARHQTGGRGRSGRSWASQPGDALLATVIARVALPPERVGVIAIAAGVAIAEALGKVGVEVGLKWPNDLIANDRKLGGILIQTQMGTPLIALIGIGINLGKVPIEVSAKAVSIADLVPTSPSPVDAARLVVPQLRDSIAELEQGRGQRIIARWTAIALWLEEEVSVIADREVVGILQGIDEFGRLCIRAETGIEHLTQGEVRRGPRKLA
jgi:BirA family biotin operon repressor/biotin-[acetyl-CoA-carboxylase] ligase